MNEKTLVVFLVLILGFTVIGPFGTYEILDMWERLVFWALCITGIAVFMNLFVILAISAPILASLPWPVPVTIGALTAAVPSAAVIVFFTAFMFPTGVQASSYPFIWFQIAMIGTIVALFQYRPRNEVPEEDEAEIVTRFHERLPKSEQHDIVSLTMHDHYVEVTTTTGRHMVLSRLSDAVAELEGLDGIRLHRSHWAAARHISGLAKQGRKSLATLSDGRSLPVGKQGLEAVQSLIDRR